MNIDKVKIGISETKIAMEMKQDSLGKSSQEMYAQFIYKCVKSKMNVCVFSKPMIYTAPSFSDFRKYISSRVNFCGGFVISASNFADVKKWPLTFSMLKIL